MLTVHSLNLQTLKQLTMQIFRVGIFHHSSVFSNYFKT